MPGRGGTWRGRPWKLAKRLPKTIQQIGVTLSVDDQVPRDDHVADGWQQLGVEAGRHDPGRVVVPVRVVDVHARGVRAGVAEAVVLGLDLTDHCLTGVALADVEPGVG